MTYIRSRRDQEGPTKLPSNPYLKSRSHFIKAAMASVGPMAEPTQMRQTHVLMVLEYATS